MHRLLLLLPLLFSLSVNAAIKTSLVLSLMDESRSTEDKARDGGRKPAEVMAFLGVEPGMTVIDVIAAGGYYTEVLSRTVGRRGKVYAQNPASVLKFRDGANDKALTRRLADNRLPNVIRWDRETTDLGIAPDSIDFAITALNFHDIYNSSGKNAAVSFSTLIFNVLKPGAVFGVIDHEGAAAADNQSLHRIQGGLALEALLEAGFSIESNSDTLRNPEDDLSKMVFDASIRGKTDRFLIKAVKPK
jgi:predicted methyltransferase